MLNTGFRLMFTTKIPNVKVASATVYGNTLNILYQTYVRNARRKLKKSAWEDGKNMGKNTRGFIFSRGSRC